jgi:hypothetical protein
LRSLLEHGHSISSALSLIDGFLPPATIAAIAVAEGGGGLAEVLVDESQRLTVRLQDFGGKEEPAASLVVWSGVLLTVFCGVCIFTGVDLAPKAQAIFQGFGLEIPPLSRAAFALLDSFSVLLPLGVDSDLEKLCTTKSTGLFSAIRLLASILDSNDSATAGYRYGNRQHAAASIEFSNPDAARGANGNESSGGA